MDMTYVFGASFWRLTAIPVEAYLSPIPHSNRNNAFCGVRKLTDSYLAGLDSHWHHQFIESEKLLQDGVITRFHLLHRSKKVGLPAVEEDDTVR